MMKFMIVTTFAALGFFSAVGSAYAQTNENCYEPTNIGTVGQAGWAGCAGMYITDSTTLRAAADAGQTSGDYQISFEGADYTFGDSGNNIFTGQVTTMRVLFAANSNFNKDIGYWDTSNVTDMGWMFNGASTFDKDISQWDTSSVVDMSHVFWQATDFNKPLGDWDVSSVTRMNGMFREASAFNQEIGSWDVSSVTTMEHMFFQATVFDRAIGSWDVSSVTTMKEMFKQSAFNKAIGDWNVRGVTIFDQMFNNNEVFDQPLGDWDVSGATNMNHMFFDATLFNQDLTTWNVPQFSAFNSFHTNSGMELAKLPNWGTGIVVANFDGTLAEGESSTFTVKLSSVPGADVAIDLTSSDASEGVLNPAQITFLQGTAANTAQTVTLTSQTDGVADGDQPYTVTVAVNASTADSVYGNKAPQTLSAVTADVDSPGLTFSTSTITVAEGAEATFTVRLYKAPQGTVVLDLSSSDTGEGVLSPTQITFAAGDNAAKTVTVTAPTDTVIDGNESYSITAAVNTASTLDDAYDAVSAATLTAVTTDATNATLSFSDVIDAPEGATSSVTVSTGGVTSESEIIIGYGATGGTAGPEDYTSASSVTIPVGATSTKIKYFFIDDDLVETSETVVVQITSAETTVEGVTTTLNLPTSNNATLTAANINTVVVSVGATTQPSEDGPQSAVVTFTQSATSSHDTTVIYTLSGTAVSGGEDYTDDNSGSVTIPAGGLTADAVFPVVDDVIGEGDETIIVSLTSVENDGKVSGGGDAITVDTDNNAVTLTITDNDVADVDNTACYNPDNLGTVGQVGWTGCAGMYITDDSTLRAAADAGQTSGDYHISFEGTDYTFGDSANNIFTGQVTTMRALFAANTNFNKDIGYWDTSNVTDMGWMFNGASTFNKDISQWDTSSVTNMNSMFWQADAFNKPLGDWDVSSVINMGSMFREASAFNQEIGSWDVSSVTRMDGMFFQATVFDQPIGSWDVSSVTTMKEMFKQSVFNKAIGDWNVRGVTSFQEMFNNNIVFSQALGDWDVSGATNMNHMFFDATQFNQDLTSWNVPQFAAFNSFHTNSGMDVDNLPKWGTGIVVENFDGTLAEGGSSTFTVGLSSIPTENVIIDLTSSDTGEGVLNPAQITFLQGTAANTAQTVTLTSQTDGVADGDQSYTVTVAVNASTTDSVYGNKAPQTLSAVTTDVDIPGLTFSTSTITVAEGAEATFTVQLDTPPQGTVVLDLSSSDPSEGVLSPAQITFAAGENAAQTVTVTAPTDTVIDGNETYSITAAVNTASTLDDVYDAVSAATLTAVTTDTTNATLSFSDVINAAEGATSSVTVSTGGVTSESEIIIGYEAASGSTAESGDYTSAPSVTIPVGATSAKIEYFFIDDDLIEPSETVVVQITSVETTVEGVTTTLNLPSSNNAAILTITDNDVANIGCYNPDNLGTVGQVGWAGCAGMYITDSTTLRAAADAGQASGNYQISFDGTDYTFGDSANNIFTGQVTTMESLFNSNSNFNEDIGYWDTSNVTNMRYMFYAATTFNKDIWKWDVSRVTDMDFMFFQAAVFDRPIGDWNVSSVTNMEAMFKRAGAFNKPLGNWDVGRVTNMKDMFAYAKAFDRPIGDWDVGSVTDMHAMFYAASLFNQDISTWNVSQIPSEPDLFSSNLATANKPKWGSGIVVVNFDGTLAEGGSTTFTVGLGSTPVADVIIDLTSSDTGEGVLSPAQITFPGGASADPQTITLTSQTDSVVDGDQSYTVTVGVNSSTGDTAYGNKAPRTLSAVTTDVDIAGLTLSTSTITVAEGAEATFSVQLDTLPQGTVVLDLSSSDTGEGVLSPTQITFAAGENAAQTVTVAAPTDTVIDGNESYSITAAVNTASTLDDVYDAVSAATLTAVTTDTTNATLSFSDVINAAEGATSSVTVSTGGVTSESEIIIGYGAASGSTAGSGDYTTAPLLTIPTGDSASTVTIPVGATSTKIEYFFIDDDLVEPSETVVVQIALAGTTVEGATTTLTLPTSNQATLTAANINTAVVSVGATTQPSETGPQSGVVTFTQSATSSHDTIVSYSLGGTATSSADYTNDNSGNVTISAGSLTATAVFSVEDDAISEGGETIIVSLTSVENVATAVGGGDAITVGSGNKATLTIADNDVVNIGVSATSTLANLVEGGATGTFTLSLETQPVGTVTVGITPADTQVVVSNGGSALISLNFDSSNYTGVTLTVTANDDKIADATTTTDINFAVTSSASDLGYTGLTASTSATVIDNDVADIEKGEITLKDLPEGGATGTFTVKLASQPTVPVTITLGTQNGELNASSSGSSTLIFGTNTGAGGWDVNQTVTVGAIHDNYDDDADSLDSVTLTVAASGEASVPTSYDGRFTSIAFNIVDHASDVVGVNYATSLLNVTEGGATTSVLVSLNSKPLGNVIIKATENVAQLKAYDSANVSSNSLTFTPSNWNVDQTMVIEAIDDKVSEGAAVSSNPDIHFNVDSEETNSAGGTGYASAAGQPSVSSRISFAVTDNDHMGINVNPAVLSVNEGDATSASFDLSLKSVAIDDVDVTIAAPNSQVEISTDGGFTYATSSVYSFTANTSPTTLAAAQAIHVRAINDNIIDGDLVENLSITAAQSGSTAYLGNIVNSYQGATSTVAVTAVDNNIASIIVTPATGTVTEGDTGSTTVFTVKLTSQPSSTVQVDVLLSQVGGNDEVFILNSGATSTTQSLNFANATSDWTNGLAVTVQANDDAAVESEDTVTVTFAANAAASDAAYSSISASSTVTVKDNDAPGVILTNSSGATLSTSTGMTVTEGAKGYFLAKLLSQPSGNVVLSVTSEDPAISGISNSTSSSFGRSVNLTFTDADWNTNQTVFVEGTEDAFVDITVDNSTRMTIAVDASTADEDYKGANINQDFPVAVTNNDTPLVLVDTSSLAAMNEGATSSFTIALANAPLADVTVSVTSGDDGIATLSMNADASAAAASQTVTFTSSNYAAQTVYVAGVDNQIDDGVKRMVDLTVANSSASGNAVDYNNIAAVDATVTSTSRATIAVQVDDDDTAGQTIPTTPLTVSEAGATSTFTVVLTSQPTDTVTYAITVANGFVTTSTSTLTFSTAAGGWNTAQTVTVFGIDNSIDEQTDSTDIITLTPSSSDANYGATTTQISVTNIDNDHMGINASPATLSVNEEGSTSATFDLSLKSVAIDDVDVTIAAPNSQVEISTDGGFTYATSSVYRFTANTSAITLADAQTIHVRAINDNIADGDLVENLSITAAQSGSTAYLGSIVNSYQGATSTVAVTAVDNNIASIIVTPATGTVTEGDTGSTTVFTVKLTSQPASAVEVDVSLSQVGGNDEVFILNSGATSTSQSLNFANATSDWTNGLAVTVQANDDAAVEGVDTVTVTFATNAASDAAYSSISASSTVTVNDNDVPGVILTNSSGATLSTSTGMTVTEGAKGYFLAKLLSQPSGNVVLSVTSEDPAISGISNSTSSSFGRSVNLTFTDADWNTNQTVFVEGTEDAFVDITVDNSTRMTIAVDASTADEDYKGANINQDFPVAVTNNDTPLVLVDTSSLAAMNEGATSSFTIALANAPLADVTVSVTSGDDGIATLSMNADASAAAASQTVTFTSSNYAAQTVYVAGVDNQIDDGVKRMVDLTVANSSASGNAVDYNNIAAVDATVTSTSRATIAVQVDDDDTAGQTIPTTPLTVSEAGATSTFTVVLTSQPTDTVTYAITVANGFVTTSTSTLTFSTAAGGWNTAQTVTVFGIDNSIDEQTDSTDIITLTPSSSDANYGATTTQISVTNIDNDHMGINASPATLSVNEEGSTSATFDLSLKSVAIDDVDVTITAPNSQVEISTDGGSAYATSSVYRFTANTSATTLADAQTIHVRAINDNIADGDLVENLSITAAQSGSTAYLGSIVNSYQGATSTVAVTAVDNNIASIIVTPATGTVTEGDTGSTTVFTVKLTSQPASAVEVDVSLSQVGGNDEVFILNSGATSTSQSLNFANATSDWTNGLAVTVQANDDDSVESEDTVTVTFAANAAASDAAYSSISASSTVTVKDNDVANIGVSATSTLANLVEGGATGTFTLSLDTQPAGTVTVSITPADSQVVVSNGGSSLTSFDFDSSNYTGVTLTVTANDDKIADATTTTDINFAVTSSASDLDYTGLTASTSVTVIDNDVADIEKGEITLKDLPEGGATGTFTVKLASQPTVPVTITLGTQNGELNASSSGSSTLIFGTNTGAGGWDVNQTVTVGAIHDNYDDDADSLDSVTLTVAASGEASVPTSYDGRFTSIAFNIVDHASDVVGVNYATSLLNVTEGGATTSVLVSLNSKPLGDVIIKATENVAQLKAYDSANVSSNSLTFNPSNWNVDQTMVIEAIDDKVSEGAAVSSNPDIHFNVDSEGTNSAGGTGYASAAGQPSVSSRISFAVTDNDHMGINASPATLSVNEEGSTSASFDLSLKSVAIDDVDVTIAAPNSQVEISTDGGFTYATSSVYRFTANTSAITLADAQTIHVRAINDNIADGDLVENLSITAAQSGSTAYLGSIVNSYQGATSTVAVTAVDNNIASIIVTPATGTVTEGDTGSTTVFTVKLTSQPASAVEVDVSLSQVGGNDEVFILNSGATSTSQSLNFANATSDWTNGLAVTVQANDDAAVEGVDTVTVTFATNAASDAAYSSISASSTVTVNDNDVPGVILTNSSGATLSTSTGMTVTEGAKGYFLAKLLSQPSGNVVLSVTSEDPAISGISNSTSSSFGRSVNLTFTDADWNTNQTVFVEGTEDAFVDITVDNSTRMTIAVDATTADEDYKGANINQDFPVAVTNNDTPLVLVDTSSLAAMNEGATSSFTIALANAPLADVTVSVTSGDDGIATLSMNADASAAAASQTVTFTSSNYAAQTVYVTGVDNQIDDGVKRMVDLTVANSSASGNAVDYNNIAAVDATVTSTSRATIAVQVDDDDTAGQTIPTTPLTVSEAGATSTFTVVLTSQPTDTVTYAITVANGFVTTSTSTLTFSTAAGGWNTAQTVTVFGIDNSIDEQTDSTDIITLTRSSSDANYGATATQISVTNIDNDQSGIDTNSVTTLTLQEGTTSTILVKLNTQPTYSVSVDVTSGNTTGGATVSASSSSGFAATATLSFSTSTGAGGWDTYQTVYVQAIQDTVLDADVGYAISLYLDSLDPNYDGDGGSNAAVNITATTTDDGDTASVITAASSTGATGTGTAGNMVTVSYLDASDVTQTATTTVASDGTWSMAFVPAGSNGSAMTIMDTDTAANVSTTVATSSKVIDATPPTLTADSENSTTKLVKGTGDAGETIVVSYTDKGGNAATATTTVAADGTWSITLNPAAKSNTAVTVTSTDANGNTATVTIASIASADIDAVEIQQDIEEVMVASGEMVIATVPSVGGFISAGSTGILSAPTSAGDTRANIKASDGSFAANLVTEGLRLSLNTTDSKTSAHIHTNDFKLGYDKGVGTLKASFTTQQMHVEIDETAAKTKLKFDGRLTPTRTKADRAGTINGWVSGELLRSEGSGNKMDLFVGRVGAHKFHDTDSLTGLMLTTDSGTGTFAADGFTTDNTVKIRSYMIGVYHGQKMQTAAGNSYNIEGQLHFGTSKMDLTTPAGDTGSTNGSRILATGRMSSDTTFGGYKFSPFIQGNYFNQKNDGFTTAQNNTVVAATKVSFADVALGTKFNYAQANGMTIGFEPSLVYRAKASGAGLNIDERTIRGRVSMDLDMPLQSAGGRLTTNVYLDGIGIASSRTYGASIKFERQF